MTDTSETQPVEAAEILRVLRDIRAQVRTNGESLTKLQLAVDALATKQGNHATTLDGVGKAVDGVAAEVARIGGLVDQAAPLLNSGPARLLSGGGLLSVVRGTRTPPPAHG